MSESAEGFSVRATRQQAGSARVWLSVGAPGGRYGPAAADSTKVTVASGNMTDFNRFARRLRRNGQHGCDKHQRKHAPHFILLSPPSPSFSVIW